MTGEERGTTPDCLLLDLIYAATMAGEEVYTRQQPNTGKSRRTKETEREKKKDKRRMREPSINKPENNGKGRVQGRVSFHWDILVERGTQNPEDCVGRFWSSWRLFLLINIVLSAAFVVVFRQQRADKCRHV